MKSIWEIARGRLKAIVGWTICTVFAMFVGANVGIMVGYMLLATGMAEPTDDLYTGWGFFTFPIVGGAIALVVMHLVRILFWVKLHRKYMSERENWTWKNTLGVVLFDEIIWLVVFAIICSILLTLL